MNRYPGRWERSWWTLKTHQLRLEIILRTAGRCGSRPSLTTQFIGVLRRLEHFGELIAKARDLNRRMLQTMRAGQDCVFASPSIERVAQPCLPRMAGGPALRFGEPRVMALASALCLTLSGACGLTSKSLRALTARLLGHLPQHQPDDLRPLAAAKEPQAPPGLRQALVVIDHHVDG